MPASFLDPAAHKDLVSRLFRLMPDAQPRWGRLTAGQMLVHCADQLRVSRGEKVVTSTRVPGLLRPLLKWLFVTRTLASGFKRGMKTLPELDPAKGMTRPVNFAADHAALLALLNPAGYGSGGIRHPLFGPLSRPEFGEITWLHLDHHLRQFGV